MSSCSHNTKEKFVRLEGLDGYIKSCESFVVKFQPV